VLGALAEAYVAMNAQDNAIKILNRYYNEKFNRFTAFRKEIKKVVKNSCLLSGVPHLVPE